MSPRKKAATVGDGLLVGAFDVHLKGSGLDRTLPARFFQDYQKEHSVWAEVLAPTPWLAGGPWSAVQRVEASSPGHLEPFPAFLGGVKSTQVAGRLSFAVELIPMQEPLESAPAKGLKEVTFGLLDSPVGVNLVRGQRPEFTFTCGHFDVSLTKPTRTHRRVADLRGSAPHVLSDSGTIRDRDGKTFSSNAVRDALETMFDALSFAAGRWAGIVLVQAVDATDQPVWSRWGTGRIGEAASMSSWYDPAHPEWIRPVCDGLVRAKSNLETWETIRTALYWYIRGNAKGVGIDSSLILSQCALELLSWFVIVQKTAALREQGYGQLSSASEKLRLALTLLGIPRQIPSGLKGIGAFRKDWDIAEAVVQARNYLVHPTESRSGRRRKRQDYPWHELSVAGRWLLELVVLRLLDYSGEYCNQTHLGDLPVIERVPWA